MVIKTTSFKLDDKLIKELKKKAIDKDITLTELIDQYLKQGLKNDN